jgi:signal transduction histidine kinase
MTANVQSLVPNNIVRSWQTWLKPISTNRDEAFRERTIRVTTTIILILSLLTLVLTVVVFGQPWKLVSLPSLNFSGVVLGLISAFAIARGKILLAGWFLVILVLIQAVAIGVISPDFQSLSTPLLMMTVLISALVLPRSSIVSIGVGSVVLLGIVTQLQAMAGGLPANQSVGGIVSNNLVMLLAQTAFLRQLRVEFDSRLAAIQDSLQQTEQAKQQAEVARQQADTARQRAEAADKAKSQFLANMSHELRTPLNAILGYTEIMTGGMAGSFTDKQKQLLGHIHHNGTRLLELINNVLNLARIESGSMEIRNSPANPRTIVNDLIGSMQSLAEKKSITLSASFDHNAPEAVICDIPKVQQILTNLIGNAVKFTSTGGVNVLVGSTDNSNWYLKVADTGMGMPADAVGYIFEMFRQVDGADTREHQGTGLGLAITKRLIERIGGTIGVETELGKGSTFTVTLPRPITDIVDTATISRTSPDRVLSL